MHYTTNYRDDTDSDTDSVIVIHRSMYGTINATLFSFIPLHCLHYSPRCFTMPVEKQHWCGLQCNNTSFKTQSHMYTHQSLLRSQDSFSVSPTAKSVNV